MYRPRFSLVHAQIKRKHDYILGAANDEINHVKFLRTALGGAAVSQPALNIGKHDVCASLKVFRICARQHYARMSVWQTTHRLAMAVCVRNLESNFTFFLRYRRWEQHELTDGCCNLQGPALRPLRVPPL